MGRAGHQPEAPSQHQGLNVGPLHRSSPAEKAEPADLSILFVPRHAELVRLALLLVGDQATAEDVFAKLHARRAKGSCGEDSLPYVRAAVLNGCRSQLRRRAVAQRFEGTSGKLLEPVAQESAGHEMIRSEERKQVLAALATLPSRRREVLVLRY
jgi:DNA-directed RNA polymerase specialized sigma24 family protein